MWWKYCSVTGEKKNLVCHGAPSGSDHVGVDLERMSQTLDNCAYEHLVRQQVLSNLIMYALSNLS